MGATDLSERLRRLLLLVPYAARHPGAPLEDLARLMSMEPGALAAELDFLLMVGQPPFAPDDCIDIRVENGRVYVDLSQAFEKPPRLTALEALALAAAAQGMAEGDDKTISRALSRIEAALPPQLLNLFRELLQRFAVARLPGEAQTAALLQKAIAGRLEVELDYYSESRGQSSVRPVRPRELRYAEGHWYLSAFCLTRQGDRHFRVDRIRKAVLSNRHFEPLAPEMIPTANGVAPSPPPDPNGERPRLRLRGGAAIRYARERFGAEAVEPKGAEQAILTLNGPADAWTVSFALSFGGNAEILSPEPLRRMAAERLTKALAKYS
jgi:proteasome accessory factor C